MAREPVWLATARDPGKRATRLAFVRELERREKIYAPLEDPRTIRLLEFFDDNRPESLECALTHSSLDNPTQSCTALSYA